MKSLASEFLLCVRGVSVCKPIVSIQVSSGNVIDNYFEFYREYWFVRAFRKLFVLLLIFLATSYCYASDTSDENIGFIRYERIYARFFDAQYFEYTIKKYENRIHNIEAQHAEIVRSMNLRIQSLKSGRKSPQPREIKKIESDILRENFRFDRTIKNLGAKKNNFSAEFKKKFYEDMKEEIKLYATEHDVTYIVNGPSTSQSPNILYEKQKIKDLTNDFISYVSKKMK